MWPDDAEILARFHLTPDGGKLHAEDVANALREVLATKSHSPETAGPTDALIDEARAMLVAANPGEWPNNVSDRDMLATIERLVGALASRSGAGSGGSDGAEPICTGCYAVRAPNGGVLVLQRRGELMIYGNRFEAEAELPKGCTLMRVDVWPSSAERSAATPNASRSGETGGRTGLRARVGEWIASQTDLPADARRVLNDNLWSLYVDGSGGSGLAGVVEWAARDLATGDVGSAGQRVLARALRDAILASDAQCGGSENLARRELLAFAEIMEREGWRAHLTDDHGIPRLTGPSSQQIRSALCSERGGGTPENHSPLVSAGAPDGARSTLPVRPEDISRVEVIDHRTPALRGDSPVGRVYVAYGASVELQYQDDGRTLKVFVEDRPLPETNR